MTASSGRTPSSGSTATGGDPAPARKWIAPLTVVLAVAAVLALPGYRERAGTLALQTRLLPRRLATDQDAVNLDAVGEPYRVMRAVREGTFPDAVVVLPDDPRDTPLNNVFWCAYYLYPRVLVHASALRSRPGLAPDFALDTAHFTYGGDSGTGTPAPGPGLVAISGRARAWAAERWRR